MSVHRGEGGVGEPHWGRGPPGHSPTNVSTVLLPPQLFCDLRTNTPKDRRFLQRHARALTPRTAAGWLVRGTGWGVRASPATGGGWWLPRATDRSVCRAWLQALLSALGFSLSGLVALACTALVLSIAGIWSALALAAASGGC